MNLLYKKILKVLQKKAPALRRISFDLVEYKFPNKLILSGLRLQLRRTMKVVIDKVEIKLPNPLLNLISKNWLNQARIKVNKMSFLDVGAETAGNAKNEAAKTSTPISVKRLKSLKSKWLDKLKYVECQSISWRSYEINKFTYGNGHLDFDLKFLSEYWGLKGTIEYFTDHMVIEVLPEKKHSIGGFNHCIIKGKLAFQDSTDITLDYEMNMNEVTLDSKLFSPKPFSISGISLLGEISFTEKCIYNRMNILVDKMPIQINNTLINEQHKILQTVFSIRVEPRAMEWLSPNFFSAFKSIQYSGGATFIASMTLNLKKLSNYQFSIITKDVDFVPINIRALEFEKLNNPFNKIIIRDNLAIRNISIKDLYFRKYESSDAYHLLRKVITFCEDPDFYNHIGVAPHFIGKAIISNLDSRRFSRGASTITMQLIKNVFLSNEKCVFRKVEEILLSLILEQYTKITKDRILDIYLQIIEFGPNIYGVKEASSYYFGKSIGALTPVEIIVLSYVIPRPLFFNEALLLRSCQLSENLKQYCRNIAKFLFQSKIFSEHIYNNSLQNKIIFSRRWGSWEVDLQQIGL